MKEEQFEEIAILYARREALIRLSESIEKDDTYKGGIKISYDDLTLIGDGLMDYTNQQIKSINDKVATL